MSEPKFVSEEERLKNVMQWRAQKGLTQKPLKRTVKSFNQLRKFVTQKGPR